MTVGYVLDNALGFLLASLSIFGPRIGSLCQNPSSHQTRLAVSRVVDAYHNSATFLALSIQVASIVVLARTDFGIDASGMGDVTVKLTWTTSVLTLLPLLYCTFIPRLGHAVEGLEECNEGPRHFHRKLKEAYRRECLRHYLFILCWMLSLYPFLSRLIETYGPSKIGDGDDAAISNADWTIIWAACHEDVVEVSGKEMDMVNATGITSWLFISIFAIASMVGFGVRRNHPNSNLNLVIDQASLLPEEDRKSSRRTTAVAWAIMVVVPLFSALQFWAYFRLQKYQRDISKATGGADADVEWGFGQVVALTLFVPILVEVWYGLRELCSGRSDTG